MVKISNYQIRQTEEGKQFVVLELEGSPEFKQSKTTGNYYVSVRKATIPATFSEETAKSMIGTNLSGSIVKQQTEPYEVVSQETGEITTMNHRYVYSPIEDDETTPQAIRELVEEGVI